MTVLGEGVLRWQFATSSLPKCPNFMLYANFEPCGRLGIIAGWLCADERARTQKKICHFLRICASYVVSVRLVASPSESRY
jgi:hypothetical protein